MPRLMPGGRLVMAVCGIGVLLGSAQADTWPRFRGPNGTATVKDQDVPVEWNKSNVLWQTPLPGKGNSSPILWGDRIFLQSASPDGKDRSLICLRAGDGEVLWTRHVLGSKARTHTKNTLASSTPATDGERVYALFWDGQGISLHGFDFTGKELWKEELGKFISQHGAGGSPIVHEGKVIVANDHDEGAEVVAVDAKTGKRLWTTPRQHFRASYATPFVLKREERTEVVVASTAGITGYDPATGKVIWHWTWQFGDKPLRAVGSAVYGDGLIFAQTGDGGGDRHAVALRPGEKGDVTNANLAWENTQRKYLPYVPCMLPRGEHVYFVNDEGFAGCLNAATGKVIWMERLPGGNITASPVMIDGKIYAINEPGDVFVVAAEPRFKVLAKNSVGEGVMASPAVANGRLYIRGEKHLFCIGRK